MPTNTPASPSLANATREQLLAQMDAAGISDADIRSHRQQTDLRTQVRSWVTEVLGQTGERGDQHVERILAQAENRHLGYGEMATEWRNAIEPGKALREAFMANEEQQGVPRIVNNQPNPAMQSRWEAYARTHRVTNASIEELNSMVAQLNGERAVHQSAMRYAATTMGQTSEQARAYADMQVGGIRESGGDFAGEGRAWSSTVDASIKLRENFNRMQIEQGITDPAQQQTRWNSFIETNSTAMNDVQGIAGLNTIVTERYNALIGMNRALEGRMDAAGLTSEQRSIFVNQQRQDVQAQAINAGTTQDIGQHITPAIARLNPEHIRSEMTNRELTARLERLEQQNAELLARLQNGSPTTPTGAPVVSAPVPVVAPPAAAVAPAAPPVPPVPPVAQNQGQGNVNPVFSMLTQFMAAIANFISNPQAALTFPVQNNAQQTTGPVAGGGQQGHRGQGV